MSKNSDPQIAAASQLLRTRLEGVMAEKGFKTREQLADYLEMSEHTIGRYFWPKKLSLPSPENLKQLRSKISVLTDEDVQILEVGYSRKLSITRSSGGRKSSGKSKKPSKESNPTTTPQHREQRCASSSPNDKDAQIGRLVRELFQQVGRNGSVAHGSFDPQELLRFNANGRYQIGDMPAVLTKETFETIDVSHWSGSQRREFLAYANLVLEQSRMCMMLVAQVFPDQIRDELLDRLGRNADLLWRTYKIASSVAPMDYIQDVDLARKLEEL